MPLWGQDQNFCPRALRLFAESHNTHVAVGLNESDLSRVISVFLCYWRTHVRVQSLPRNNTILAFLNLSLHERPLRRERARALPVSLQGFRWTWCDRSSPTRPNVHGGSVAAGHRLRQFCAHRFSVPGPEPGRKQETSAVARMRGGLRGLESVRGLRRRVIGCQPRAGPLREWRGACTGTASARARRANPRRTISVGSRRR